MTTADELAPGDWVRIADEVHRVDSVDPSGDHVVVVTTADVVLVLDHDEAVEVLG